MHNWAKSYEKLFIANISNFILNLVESFLLKRIISHKAIKEIIKMIYANAAALKMLFIS